MKSEIVRRSLLVIAVGSFGLTPVWGERSVLYWTDGVAGDDAMADALDGLVMSEEFAFSVTTATGDADFTSKINSGNYDLGILFVQADASGYASSGALADFAESGGLAMYANFSGDNDDVSPFGYQFTGTFNESSVTITDPQLESPFDLDSPLSLSSPGWLDFSFGLSPTGEDGVVLAEFGNGDAAVVRTFPGGRVMGFGMLNDTFTDHNEGVDFFTNALVAIPEPSTYVALLGATVFVVVLSRRWRHQTSV